MDVQSQLRLCDAVILYFVHERIKRDDLLRSHQVYIILLHLFQLVWRQVVCTIFNLHMCVCVRRAPVCVRARVCVCVRMCGFVCVLICEYILFVVVYLQ